MDMLMKYELFGFYGLGLNRVNFAEPQLWISCQKTNYQLIEIHLESTKNQKS